MAPLSKGAAHKLPKAIYGRGIQRQGCTNSPNPSANTHLVLRIPPTSLALGHLPLTREALGKHTNASFPAGQSSGLVGRVMTLPYGDHHKLVREVFRFSRCREKDGAFSTFCDRAVENVGLTLAFGAQLR